MGPTSGSGTSSISNPGSGRDFTRARTAVLKPRMHTNAREFYREEWRFGPVLFLRRWNDPQGRVGLIPGPMLNSCATPSSQLLSFLIPLFG